MEEIKMNYYKLINELTQSSTIPLDVLEEENKYVIIAEVPGVPAEQLEVQLNFDFIEISINSTRDSEQETPEDLQYIHREIPFGSMKRRLTLSKPIDSKASSMKLNNGLLVLDLPYAEEAKKVNLKIN